MVRISDEYYTIAYGGRYAGLFYNSVSKGDYWIRRAAKKGNLIALHRIIQQWGYSNPHEVVYWLKHGCDLGIPWCAEELASAYWSGRYQLPSDPGRTGKAREYDNLAVEIHRTKGTLQKHNCILLPVVGPSGWPRVLPKEIHPGIPRESAPLNPAALEERKRQIQRSAPQGQELVEALKQLEPVKQQALKGDVFAMADLALRYARLGEPHFKTATEWYERAAKAGDSESAMKLVEAYRDGALGLPKDPAKSDAWFKIWQHNESMQPLFNRLSITQITPKAQTPNPK